MHPSNGQLCDRARHWASLRVDDELSELEAALFDAHLVRCEACARFASDALGIAHALRTAPLEWAEPVVLDVPRLIDRRRARVRLLQSTAAATFVVAAALAGSLIGLARHTTSVVSAVGPTAMVASNESGDQLRRLRRAGLIEATHPVPRNRSDPGSSV